MNFFENLNICDVEISKKLHHFLKSLIQYKKYRFN
jgi:hypothetical protein